MTQQEYEANRELDYAIWDILDRVAERMSATEARILAYACSSNWTPTQEKQNGEIR